MNKNKPLLNIVAISKLNEKAYNFKFKSIKECAFHNPQFKDFRYILNE